MLRCIDHQLLAMALLFLTRSIELNLLARFVLCKSRRMHEEWNCRKKRERKSKNKPHPSRWKEERWTTHNWRRLHEWRTWREVKSVSLTNRCTTGLGLFQLRQWLTQRVPLWRVKGKGHTDSIDPSVDSGKRELIFAHAVTRMRRCNSKFDVQKYSRLASVLLRKAGNCDGITLLVGRVKLLPVGPRINF